MVTVDDCLPADHWARFIVAIISILDLSAIYACYAPTGKLQTEMGKAIYGLRKSTVEPVIGIIKETLGFRQFSLRGLAAVAGEWCLVCLAFDLWRLHSLRGGC